MNNQGRFNGSNRGVSNQGSKYPAGGWGQLITENNNQDMYNGGSPRAGVYNGMSPRAGVYNGMSPRAGVYLSLIHISEPTRPY